LLSRAEKTVDPAQINDRIKGDWSMISFTRSLPLALACLAASACNGGSALQPDRSIFSLDNNYQRHAYNEPIEATFEQTVTVFKEAGYKLDVIDRATGQISGTRGASGDKGSSSDKDLKFYALVLPDGAGSELGIKIVQVLRRGALGSSRAELIVNDAVMYQFLFRRVENASALVPAAGRFDGVGGVVDYNEF
jgi:hypothetical protein